MPQTAPALSFIIPAYNAADTLEITIGSLKSQTRADWQAVIVDDGSTDATLAVAHKLAAEDVRLKVITQANGGVSAARNAGVEVADAAWICLLDADDWLDRRYIEKMLAPLTDDTMPVASYCSFRRVVEDGMRPVEWTPDLTGDKARKAFSRHCVLAVFCVVFRKADYRRLGGMNSRLRTAEDWEFWLRLAFADVSFIEIRHCLCYYYNRPHTLSTDMTGLATDALKVLRLAQKLEAEGSGQPAPTADASYFLYVIAWCAGWQIASGREGISILALLSPLPDISGEEHEIAGVIFQGLRLGLASSAPNAVIKAVALWEPHLAALFETIEAASYPGLSRNLWSALSAHIVANADMEAPLRLANVCAFSVNISDTPNILKPDGVDTLVVGLKYKGKVKNVYAGPMWGKFGPASLNHAIEHFPRLVLADYARKPGAMILLLLRLARGMMREWRKPLQIIVREADRKAKLRLHLRHIMRDALRRTDILPADEDGLSMAKLRLKALSADFSSTAPTQNSQPEDELTEDNTLSPQNAAYWEQVFARPDPWNYLSPYETKKYQQTIEILGDEPIGYAMEVACAEGIFTRMIRPHVDHLLAVDISTRALERARKRCADLDGIKFEAYNLIEDTPPVGLNLIICSEVLYYVGGEERVREIAAKFSAALAEGGRFVTAHPHRVSDEPHRTGFDWDNQLGVATVRDIFMNTPGLVLEKTMECELYAIHCFRKTHAETATAPKVINVAYGQPEADVARHIIWGGVAKSRSEAMADEVVSQIPVLMYHRIAAEGPDALAPYRIAPEAFEAQLRLLRRHGYYTLSVADLSAHLHLRRPVPGRPVVITFDDAYQDFADAAFPILERNDFTADVFAVTGKVGKTSDWDAHYGGTAPLMDWPEIERLSAKGIRFGSHMETHSPATRLSLDALLKEALQSKLTLEQRLGRPAAAIALPYGIYDARVEPILELCGYDSAFSTEYGFVHLDSPQLRLPRLDIHGGLTLDQFAALVRIPS